jgi:hypothetical protein
VSAYCFPDDELASQHGRPFEFAPLHALAGEVGTRSRLADKSGNPNWPGISETFGGESTESLLMERLPQFDFVAVGIVYPREAAVAFVLALRVDADAFFR